MKKVLAEVYAVISKLGGKFRANIPDDVWETIELNKDNNHNPIIDENKGLNEQGLLDDTICFIAMLHRDYWCDSDEERQELMVLFQANEERLHDALKNAGNTRGLLKNLHKNG
ncbi:MAG: hypothetical protein LBL34_02800 [Clostridiales bacterium]|nr:hypothetical protein [Clostridiales bacterium]